MKVFTETKKCFFSHYISCGPLVVTRRTAPLSVTFVSEQVSVWKFHLFMEELFCFESELMTVATFQNKSSLIVWNKTDSFTKQHK